MFTFKNQSEALQKANTVTHLGESRAQLNEDDFFSSFKPLKSNTPKKEEVKKASEEVVVPP